MAATPAWLASVEALLNRRIAESAAAAEAARRLEGASLSVAVEGIATLRTAVRAERVSVSVGDGAPADVRVSGSPGALLELWLGGSTGGGARRRAAGTTGATGATGADATGGAGVRIEGDAEVAARFRELLKRARPDPEEELSRLVGDVPARALGRLGRAASAWARRAERSARANLAEYLTEESRLLVSRAELEEFLAGTDRLRDTADRVEARLALIEQRHKGSKDPGA